MTYKEQILSMETKKFTLQEISEIVGCNIEHVYNLCRKYDLPHKKTMKEAIEDKKVVLDDFGVDYSLIDFTIFKNEFELDLFFKQVIKDSTENPYNPRLQRLSDDKYLLELRDQRVMEMKDKGMTLKQIAEELNLPSSTVRSAYIRKLKSRGGV